MDGSKIVKSGYDEIAEKYHAQRGRFDNSGELLKFMKMLPKKGRVLDAGCGAGVPIAKTLAKNGFEIVGIDISEGMLELANKNVPKGKFLKKDMTRLDFEGNSFDGAVSFYAIIHVPRERHVKIYEGLHAALKPKGILLACVGINEWEAVEEYMGTKMFWSEHSLEKELRIIREAGFEVLSHEVKVIGGERHCWVFARNVKKS